VKKVFLILFKARNGDFGGLLLNWVGKGWGGRGWSEDWALPEPACATVNAIAFVWCYNPGRGVEG
jgi:hypothetical protein